jgi:hypothetical protein
MALVVTLRGTGSNATSATTYAFSPSNNFASQSLALVALVYDNAGSAGVDPFSAFSDNHDNTYNLRISQLNDPGGPNAGTTLRVYETNMNVATLTTSSTFTFTFSNTTPAKVYTLWEISSNEQGTASFKASSSAFIGTQSPVGPQTRTSLGIALIANPVLVGEIVISFTAFEIPATSITSTGDIY